MLRVDRILLLTLLMGALVAFASGCAPSPTAPGSDGEQVLPVETPDGGSVPPSAGSQLAPGLNELEDGSAQAVGTLEWRDVEGGFWVITGGTEAEGNVGVTVAVVANGQEFQGQLEPLDGKQVLVTGKTLDGASIRMAGPEIEIDSVQAIDATPGPAE